jgi:transposase
VRRSTGSVVTWRRAQMVLLSAQGMHIAEIARVTFTSPDRVRDVIHNFNLDGFDSLYPRYRGGRPPTFTLAQRRSIKQLALSRPQDHDLPFSTWSLAKLADFLVAEGVVDDISHEGLRVLLRQEGVSFQRLKTWKQSRDPDFEAKKNRILHLYGLMDGTTDVLDGDPEVVICIDEFGPLNLQPRQARASAVASFWCSCAMCARSTRPGAARLGAGQLPARTCRPREDPRVGQWAQANNVELAYVPTNASWLNRIEAQFTALRYLTLDGTDHASHTEQANMIRRYVAWRNRNAHDRRLDQIVNRANVA